MYIPIAKQRQYYGQYLGSQCENSSNYNNAWKRLYRRVKNVNLICTKRLTTLTSTQTLSHWTHRPVINVHDIVNGIVFLELVSSLSQIFTNHRLVVVLWYDFLRNLYTFRIGIDIWWYARHIPVSILWHIQIVILNQFGLKIGDVDEIIQIFIVIIGGNVLCGATQMVDGWNVLIVFLSFVSVTRNAIKFIAYLQLRQETKRWRCDTHSGSFFSFSFEILIFLAGLRRNENKCHFHSLMKTDGMREKRCAIQHQYADAGGKCILCLYIVVRLSNAYYFPPVTGLLHFQHVVLI